MRRKEMVSHREHRGHREAEQGCDVKVRKCESEQVRKWEGIVLGVR